MNKSSDEEKSASLLLNNIELEQVLSCPHLGVQHLKWDGHIPSICKNILQKVAVLCRLRKVLSKRMLCHQCLHNTQLCIDYAILAWGLVFWTELRPNISIAASRCTYCTGNFDFVTQISWKNFGGNILIQDVIIIPQRSCTNALIRLINEVSLRLKMFPHIHHELPSMVMYMCTLLNCIVNG